MPLIFCNCTALIASRCMKGQRTQKGNCPRDLTCQEEICQGKLGNAGEKRRVCWWQFWHWSSVQTT